VFAAVARDTRLRLRLTQREVATGAAVSRGYVARVELGTANPTLDAVERISHVLGIEAELVFRTPTIIGSTMQRDVVHAHCAAYVERRLRNAGWLTAREVEVVQARSHGWIDVLAFNPGDETLLVIEIKTQLDDLGIVERQLGWYGRSAGDVARRIGWTPRRIAIWLVVLASDEVDAVIANNVDVLRERFPLRARTMLAWLSDGRPSTMGWGLGMVDPTSKRRDWLIRSRVDGRRSPARFANYAAAARRLVR
jgi:transcriptional regulator with XRE-family HTH domain